MRKLLDLVKQLFEDTVDTVYDQSLFRRRMERAGNYYYYYLFLCLCNVPLNHNYYTVYVFILISML